MNRYGRPSEAMGKSPLLAQKLREKWGYPATSLWEARERARRGCGRGTFRRRTHSRAHRSAGGFPRGRVADDFVSQVSGDALGAIAPEDDFFCMSTTHRPAGRLSRMLRQISES